MNLRHKLIVPSADMTIMMCGVYLATYQISLLQISQIFQLDSLMMGVLIAIQYMGLCLPPLFLGTLSEKIGKKGVLTISIPMMIAGVLIITLTNSLGLFIVGILLCGAGYSVSEATMTATLCVEFSQKSAFHLGISQACFSVGAVLAPFWCESLFNAGHSYHTAFGIVVAVLTAVYILFLFTKHQNDITGSAHSGIGKALRFFSKKTFILISVAMLMSVGIEETVAFFTDSFFELTRGMPQFSALALSLFWGGMILPRIFLGAIKLTHKTTFTICGIGIAVCALAIILVPIAAMQLVLYALLGMFVGPTWPLIMDIVAKKYPENAGSVSNVMMSVSGLGGAVMPLLAGALVVGADFGPVLITAAVCGVIMAVAFSLAVRKQQSV